MGKEFLIFNVFIILNLSYIAPKRRDLVPRDCSADFVPGQVHILKAHILKIDWLLNKLLVLLPRDEKYASDHATQKLCKNLATLRRLIFCPIFLYWIIWINFILNLPLSSQIWLPAGSIAKLIKTIFGISAFFLYYKL